MLKIILGCKDEDKYLKNKKYVNYNDGLFDDEYEEEWFEDPFVKRILADIDNIDLSKSNGSSLKNSITGNIHSPKELSTGCKTLILIYKYSDVIFQARFGDNCTDLLEEIALHNDITIKSDYLHAFNFTVLSEIEYINYGVKAKCKKDIHKLLTQFRIDNADEILSDTETKMETLEELRLLHPYMVMDIEKKMREANKK